MNEESNIRGAGGVLVLIACGISMVPVLGFSAWFLSAPLLLAAFILAIVAMAKGESAILLLLTSMIFAPAFILMAPIISTLAAGGVAKAMSPRSSSQTTSAHDIASPTGGESAVRALPPTAPTFTADRTMSWDPVTRSYVEHQRGVSVMQSRGMGSYAGTVNNQPAAIDSDIRKQWGWKSGGTALDRPAH